MTYLRKRALLFFLVFTFLIYLIYVLFLNRPEQNIYADMNNYLNLALNISNGNYLNKWNTFYPPGMPYLMSLFLMIFKQTVALKIIAILLAVFLTASNYLVFLISLEISKSKKIAWFAMIFCSFYYPFITYIGFYLSEVPFTFFMLLAIWFYLKIFINQKKQSNIFAFNAGLILAVVVLFRSIFFPSALLLMIFSFFLNKKNYLKICYYIIGFILILTIIIIRNSYIMGRLTFVSTNGGINAYLGQAHLAKVNNQTDESTTFFYNNNCGYDKTLIKEETFNFNAYDEDKFYNKIFQLWKKDPLSQIKISIVNGAYMFYPIKHWPIRNNNFQGSLDLIFQYFFVILVYLPFVYLIFKKIVRRKFSKYDAVLLLPITGLVLMAMITKGEERYLVPYQYLMVIFVAPVWSNFIIIFKKNISNLKYKKINLLL
ncbi:MAG: hypothetical protein WCW17_03240 [Patescibacteria group bacterium]|jgi:4-amino-4-deoxy-L-arabinose transferase-like glycosyltransferase